MKTIIFIIGAGHSGSTLLAKALNSHSNIFSLSEISQFYEDINNEIAHCGCGIPLKECSFWEGINLNLKEKIGYGIKERPEEFRISRKLGKDSILYRIWFRITRVLAININLKTGHIRNRLENITNLYESVFEKTKANILIDSSKSAKRAKLFRSYLISKGYHVKVIHLVRDGRAVLYSYQKGYYNVHLTDKLTGKSISETFFAENIKSKEEIVKIWKQANIQSIFYHKFLDRKNYYFLRYEDFTAEPENTLKNILSFIGLNYETEMADLNRYVNHMISGNASRINAKKILKPYNDWELKISEEQRKYFRKEASILNRKFGYI